MNKVSRWISVLTWQPVSKATRQRLGSVASSGPTELHCTCCSIRGSNSQTCSKHTQASRIETLKFEASWQQWLHPRVKLLLSRDVSNIQKISAILYNYRLLLIIAYHFIHISRYYICIYAQTQTTAGFDVKYWKVNQLQYTTLALSLSTPYFLWT
jgi:hypothetical protein